MDNGGVLYMLVVGYVFQSPPNSDLIVTATLPRSSMPADMMKHGSNYAKNISIVTTSRFNLAGRR